MDECGLTIEQLMKSGKLPFVQALSSGGSLEKFATDKRENEVSLLSRWIAARRPSVRELRADINRLRRITRREDVERHRWVIQHVVAPIRRESEFQNVTLYTDAARAQDLAEFDTWLTERQGELREMRRQERVLTLQIAWAEEQIERILSTINPLSDWFEALKTE